MREDGWIEAQLEGATLGDVRRTRRAMHVANEMLEQPGVSLPQLAETRYDLKASYALFAHPKSTPDHLQAGHRARVQAQLRAPGASLLLVEDTSVFSWAGHLPVAGLGPIGDGGAGLQGFLLHSVLALRWAGRPEPQRPQRPTVEILGLADQQYHVRTPVPPEEAALPRGSRSFARQQRERESGLWRESTRHLGPAPPWGRWVRICDRGADLYEFLEECGAAGHGYVVRAAQNRALAEGGELFARLRAQEAAAEGELPLRTRPQQAARTARLKIAWIRTRLRSPRRPGAQAGSRSALEVTALRVWEAAPSGGTQALEWILLTDREVGTGTEAMECVQQYATRWVIEEFHKVLKSGLGAERLQLERAERLFAAIALMSVVAVRLLNLKEWLRVNAEAPASEASLDPLEHQLLELQTRRPLRSVRDVALALGRLGGHLGRKGDGLPGWITLWRGMQRLQAMALGAQLILQDRRFGE